MLLYSGSPEQYWISLLYSIPAVLIALCFHEFAHAWIAYKLGDPTAKMSGRMTIDPTKHLSLFGTIAMIFCGFGWAKPVPVDSRNFRHPKRDMILVSVAGVCMNLLVSFVAYVIMFVVTLNVGYNDIFLNIMYPIVSLNICLLVFNVIPIPPLDGYRIIEALFIKRDNSVTMFLNRFGFIILLFLLFTGVINLLLSYVTNGLIDAYGMFFSLFIPM